MPSLSSFVNSSQYTKENLTFPFIAAMRMGSTYSGISFAGTNGAALLDPGGIFGWLIYARTSLASPTKGSTTDSYLVYTNPYDLVGDLNLLTGVTSCLISATGAGGTYAFFTNIGSNQVESTSIGNQFLHAINYLAYGGTAVIAGSVAGLSKYVQDSENYFDVLIDTNYDSSAAQWLINQPYTIGIFPSIPETGGLTGSGFTLPNFTALFGSASYVTGSTGVANRVFTVCGLKTLTNLDVSTLQTGAKLTYTISTVNDVAGFFARAKNRNESYLTVAGLDRSTVINGNLINPIEWNSEIRTALRTNRVNFFVNYNPKFLGSDLVGATANATITVNDRVGPARMRADLIKTVNEIGLRYVFNVNNQTTRDQVISEVQTALDPFSTFLDTTKTQIICNSSNNTENSDQLRIDLVVKPIVSTDSLLISLTYTQ